jgi:glycosyltransferase involved in cell wall biosynthesis
MVSVSFASPQSRSSPRTLAGATILQIVPALREEPNARTAVNTAHALLQAGARALVAGASGPLVNELKAFGGEWISLANESIDPFRLRRNARVLESIIAADRIDIIHAQSAGGAWSARSAADRIAVWLVTTLPDIPVAPRGWFAASADALARGDRIISPSIYAATPVMKRLGIPGTQVTIIPRSTDTAAFNPDAIEPQRLDALRSAWDIGPSDRVVLTPGRVAPWNNQILLPEVARALRRGGMRDLVFVIVGENQSNRGYARSVARKARAEGVGGLFRLVGHCRDMPAAYGLAEIVAVPAIAPPVLGSVVAQAQAMGRPVVTSNVGVLPEHVIAPPQFPDDVRTGWVTAASDAQDLTRALELALSLDANDYRTMSARAREFAEYMFSPESVAAATRAVYTSLLAGDI